MKKRSNQLWEWIFSSKEKFEDGSSWEYSWHDSQARAAILTVILFIFIAAAIFLVIWLDNYIRYNY